MRLDLLSEGQYIAVTTLDAPLFIQAGAGTGKTYTLTQRLVHALSPGSGEEGERDTSTSSPPSRDAGAPYLSSVDEFMTITFTKKAAGELLGRIRAALRAEGLEDASLEIDSAWVSTIDSMCRRLLENQALEVGIDASAVLLDELDQALYRGVLFDAVLREREGDEHFQSLLDDYGLATIRDFVEKNLMAPLMRSPHGPRGVTVGPAPCSHGPIEALRDYAIALDEADAALQKAIAEGNAAKTTWGMLDAVRDIRKSVDDILRGEAPVEEQITEFIRGLNPSFAQSRKSDIEEINQRFAEATVQFILDCLVARQHEDISLLLGIAQEIRVRYQAFKRINGFLDIPDLIGEAYRLLTEHPEVARRYREQFRLIMVDEFQDTDQMQVSLIDRMVPEGMRTLATVGDQQQAIYGFRGADVSVFLEQREKMTGLSGQVPVSLSRNFRSHDQILRLVDRIFGQETVFGNSLIPLEHGRDEGKVGERFKRVFDREGEPRVKLLMAAGNTRQSPRGTGIDTLRTHEARMIAHEFAALKKRGLRPGDMALLLRSLKHATLYIDALREQGLESVISGGSVFYDSPEVAVLISLLQALANPLDEYELLAVLVSPLLNLSDEELLKIGGGGRMYAGLRESDGGRLQATAALFEQALATADAMGTAQALREMVAASGWVTHLLRSGAEGMAALGNITKFISLIEIHERRDGSRLVDTAWYFRRLRSHLKAGGRVDAQPHTLQSDTSDAVRIMSIHNSKGLEFPVVAVSGCGAGKTAVPRFYSERDGERVCCALRPSPWPGDGNFKVGTRLRRAIDARMEQAANEAESSGRARDTLQFFAHLRDVTERAGQPEEQRVFYVACTRARESLILGLFDKKMASLPPGLPETPRAGIMGDLESGLFPQTGFPRQSTDFSFGVSDSPYCGRYLFEDTVDGDAEADTRREEYAASTTFEAVFPRPLSSALNAIRPLVEKLRHLHSYTSLVRKSADALPDLSFADPSPAAVSAPLASSPAAPFTSFVIPLGRAKSDNRATIFGSAFHAALQRWLDSATATVDLDEIARNFGLTDGEIVRLKAACGRWAGSERAASLSAYPAVFSEYPFVVEVAGDTPLEGKIDLLGLDRGNRRALIIDYKTGVSAEGDADELRERYRFQATCYAQAILTAFGNGVIEMVEAIFVRPEVPVTSGMEEISFVFTAPSDTQGL
jgi:ATP-dependent exoDNAse (exonuclease V) beta subunit